MEIIHLWVNGIQSLEEIPNICTDSEMDGWHDKETSSYYLVWIFTTIL